MAAHIKLHILQCGSILVSRDTVEGGKNFYLPAARAMSPVRGRTALPVFCYLIEHPRGLVLMDTGWNRAVSPEGVYDPGAAAKHLTAPLAAYYRPVLEPGQAVHEQLLAKGIRPEELDYVLLSHLDADHVSGLEHVSGAKHILCSQEDYWWSCRTVYRLRQPQSLWLSDKLETFWYKGTSLGPHNWSYDLFGDDSVQLINLPGHTDGMFGIKLQQNGRFVLLVSDAAYSSAAWQQLSVPGFGFNPKAQQKSLEWIRQQSREPGCLAIYTSHDPEGTSGQMEL